MLKFTKIKTFSLAIILLGVFSFGFSVKAQTPQEIIGNIQNNIQVLLTPQYPKAGETVLIHLESYGTPLDEANISWIVGGKVLNSGYGATDFSVVAGKIGTKSKITAKIITNTKSVVEKTITIQPADIDLLWQATSYTPPFYQGKALYPHQGLITFTAVPSVSADKNIIKSAGSYIYTWKKDGDILGDFSGYGKNTFSLRGTIISRPFNIEVVVSSTDGVSLGSAVATINPISPQIAIYENNPLSGVLYSKNISEYKMNSLELSLYSVPFYFNTGTEPTSLQYAWSINGVNVVNQTNPSTLTIRNETGSKGSSNIGLKISNTLKTLQFSSKTLSVNFDKN